MVADLVCNCPLTTFIIPDYDCFVNSRFLFYAGIEKIFKKVLDNPCQLVYTMILIHNG